MDKKLRRQKWQNTMHFPKEKSVYFCFSKFCIRKRIYQIVNWISPKIFPPLHCNNRIFTRSIANYVWNDEQKWRRISLRAKKHTQTHLHHLRVALLLLLPLANFSLFHLFDSRLVGQRKKNTIKVVDKNWNHAVRISQENPFATLQTKFTNVIIACLTVQHIHQRRFHCFESLAFEFSYGKNCISTDLCSFPFKRTKENWSEYPKPAPKAKFWLYKYSNFYSFGVVFLRHIFCFFSLSHWSGWAVHCTYWLKMDEQKFKIKNTLIALFSNVCRSVDY